MFIINTDLCTACGLCADVCPEEAIDQIGIYTIKQDLCTACGICQQDCPSGAIILIKTETA